MSIVRGLKVSIKVNEYWVNQYNTHAQQWIYKHLDEILEMDV